MKLLLTSATAAALLSSTPSIFFADAFVPDALSRRRAFAPHTRRATFPRLRPLRTFPAKDSLLDGDDANGAVSSSEKSSQPPRKSRPPYVPGRISDPSYVRIFDTTLRDGEQSPGATLTSSEKLEIARQLAKLGVDVIEAGFPVASPDDFSGVKRIADVVGNEVFEDGYVPVICGLSRANPKDIKVAWDAIKGAKLPRIHTFIATSPIHMKSKLKKTPDEVVEIAVDAVKYARSLGCDDVEFSPEDAGRSDPEFLYRILGEVVEAGATTLNIPDTTGWNMPWEFGDVIAKLRANVPGAENVVFSTHCHNDLGLATANSLAGALNGARQLECTVNGIGERAGNASLEEIVMSLALKGASKFGKRKEGGGKLHTGINPVYISPTSHMVAEYTGMQCQPHKAIVGANAFQHESGIHQDGMIKNKETYEIMTPESIGLMRGDSQSGAGIVLGKHSGRNAVRTRLRELGYDLDGDKFDAVFVRFKEIAERRKGGFEDDDLEALVSDQAGGLNELWRLSGLQVSTGMSGLPTATVQMVGPDGVERHVAAVGTGPVDATYKAIDHITGVSVNLESYDIKAVTEGIEALATTNVVVAPVVGTPTERHSVFVNPQTGETHRHRFHGTGSDTDVLTSSARAYVSALNKLLSWHLRRSGRQGGTQQEGGVSGDRGRSDAAEEPETEKGKAAEARGARRDAEKAVEGAGDAPEDVELPSSVVCAAIFRVPFPGDAAGAESDGDDPEGGTSKAREEADSLAAEVERLVRTPAEEAPSLSGELLSVVQDAVAQSVTLSDAAHSGENKKKESENQMTQSHKDEGGAATSEGKDAVTEKRSRKGSVESMPPIDSVRAAIDEANRSHQRGEAELTGEEGYAVVETLVETRSGRGLMESMPPVDKVRDAIARAIPLPDPGLVYTNNFTELGLSF